MTCESSRVPKLRGAQTIHRPREDTVPSLLSSLSVDCEEDIKELRTHMGASGQVVAVSSTDAQPAGGGASSRLGTRMNNVIETVKEICARFATDDWIDSLRESSITKPLNTLVSLSSEAAHLGDEVMLAKTAAFTTGLRHGKAFMKAHRDYSKSHHKHAKLLLLHIHNIQKFCMQPSIYSEEMMCSVYSCRHTLII